MRPVLLNRLSKIFNNFSGLCNTNTFMDKMRRQLTFSVSLLTTLAVLSQQIQGEWKVLTPYENIQFINMS